MRLAMLGGSFNPVHVGHLCLAEAALVELGYERVILVPAFVSPFKREARGPGAEDRLDMLAASIAGDPRLALDDCEIRREGVSYTIDTVRDIRERYRPTGPLGLILGDDLAAAFPAWRRVEDLVRETALIVARREAAAPGGPAFPYPCAALRNDVVNVSSRTVRERIRGNGAWRYLVPEGARRVIEDRRLYGLDDGGPAAARPAAAGQDLIVRVENAAREALPPARFLHSRNTAILTWDLCRRSGLDPAAGYLAGIGHDLCKSMGDDELLDLAGSDGRGFTALERKKPRLLHGRAAAVLLERRYGVADPAVLEAVREHTAGAPGMGPLAKAVYAADKVEVSRRDLPEALREARETAGVEDLFRAVLENTVSYLTSRGMEVAPATLELIGRSAP